MKYIYLVVINFSFVLVNAQIKNHPLDSLLSGVADSINYCNEEVITENQIGLLELLDYYDPKSYCIRVTENFLEYRMDIIESSQYTLKVKNVLFIMIPSARSNEFAESQGFDVVDYEMREYLKEYMVNDCSWKRDLDFEMCVL